MDNFLQRHGRLAERVRALDTFATPWHDPNIGGLNTPWVNVALLSPSVINLTKRAAWRIVADRVSLRGGVSVTTDTTPNLLFTLPSVASPRGEVVVNTLIGGAARTLVVSPNGEVRFLTTPANFLRPSVKLNGVMFDCGNLS